MSPPPAITNNVPVLTTERLILRGHRLEDWPDNAASFRVAEKCGFTKFAETTFKDTPVILLERHS